MDISGICKDSLARAWRTCCSGHAPQRTLPQPGGGFPLSGPNPSRQNKLKLHEVLPTCESGLLDLSSCGVLVDKLVHGSYMLEGDLVQQHIQSREFQNNMYTCNPRAWHSLLVGTLGNILKKAMPKLKFASFSTCWGYKPVSEPCA